MRPAERRPCKSMGRNSATLQMDGAIEAAGQGALLRSHTIVIARLVRAIHVHPIFEPRFRFEANIRRVDATDKPWHDVII